MGNRGSSVQTIDVACVFHFVQLFSFPGLSFLAFSSFSRQGTFNPLHGGLYWLWNFLKVSPLLFWLGLLTLITHVVNCKWRLFAYSMPSRLELLFGIIAVFRWQELLLHGFRSWRFYQSHLIWPKWNSSLVLINFSKQSALPIFKWIFGFRRSNCQSTRRQLVVSRLWEVNILQVLRIALRDILVRKIHNTSRIEPMLLEMKIAIHSFLYVSTLRKLS